MKIPTIHIDQVALAYRKTPVFNNLSLTLLPSTWVALLGPSGIGKSSFLRLLAGLTKAEEKTEGRIICDNHIPLSEQVAYMAQTDLLLPWFSVLDNVLLGMKLRNTSTNEKKAEQDKALYLLDQVGLQHAKHFYPHQLSGGMRQRVALVRTLMEKKPIVLMDEPFSALDAITRYELQALAFELLKEKTVLFITHDPTEALRLAHEIYIMQGQPASLKHITTLSSKSPRDLNHPHLIALQSSLFAELLKAKGNCA